MTFQERERRRRMAGLKRAVRSARSRFCAALQTKEYEIALACQIEIDHLQAQARRLGRRNGHEPFPRWDEIC